MYKALRAQSKAETIAAGEVSVPEGRYSVEYISPVNADGSMYKVPKTATVDVSAAGIFVDTAEIGENSSESTIRVHSCVESYLPKMWTLLLRFFKKLHAIRTQE